MGQMVKRGVGYNRLPVRQAFERKPAGEEALKLSVEERIRKVQNFHKTVEELRAAGKRHRLAAAKEEKA